MKKCVKCKMKKPLNDFRKISLHKNIFRSSCKDCENEIARIRQRTKSGVVYKIYSNQKENSKKRAHQPPTYTIQEFQNWLFSHPKFDSLFKTWKVSNYNRWLAPSVDRKDDYKGYSFDNIQLMTWKENHDKGYADRMNGVNNKTNKSVILMDLEGNELAVFYSIANASRNLGVNRRCISNACNGKNKTSGGYKWKYTT